MHHVACSGFDASARDTLKLASRWSPPVRFRYTRNMGRAQQRNTTAATGSSLVSLRTFPAPNYRSAFSKHLARIAVKPDWRRIARDADADQKKPSLTASSLLKFDSSPRRRLGSRKRESSESTPYWMPTLVGMTSLRLLWRNSTNCWIFLRIS